jgi:hypothetical protein
MLVLYFFSIEDKHTATYGKLQQVFDFVSRGTLHCAVRVGEGLGLRPYPHAFFLAWSYPLFSSNPCSHVQDTDTSMSVRAPSVIGLVGVLQQHGLSYAQLAAFVAACRAAHSGPVVFQVAEGRIRSVEVQASRRRRERLAHD